MKNADLDEKEESKSFGYYEGFKRMESSISIFGPKLNWLIFIVGAKLLLLVSIN